MKPEGNKGQEVSARKVSAGEVQEAMRSLAAELGRLNHAVGQRVDLRPGDLEVLDVVARVGPVSPSWLADSLSIHPATLTGVLDRLEADSWVRRQPDPGDRRRVLVHAQRGRGGELLRLYAPMARAITELCSRYSAQELATILDFLERARDAGRGAADHTTSQTPSTADDGPQSS